MTDSKAAQKTDQKTDQLQPKTDAKSLTELPAVATNIHLMCKKCGVERYHVVVAHTATGGAKVKCEVCGASSTFKLAKPKKAAVAGAKKKAPKTKAPDFAAMWSELKTQIGTERVVPYNMKTRFSLANAIEHPKFGIGFVTSATPEKIEVVFQEGGRALVHNRAP
jgi:uncharacterized Zn finger protein